MNGDKTLYEVLVKLIELQEKKPMPVILASDMQRLASQHLGVSLNMTEAHKLAIQFISVRRDASMRVELLSRAKAFLPEQIYVSAVTAKGNSGASKVSQEKANMIAAQLDRDGCVDCVECIDCFNCVGCSMCHDLEDSKYCVYCSGLSGAMHENNWCLGGFRV